MYYLTQYQVTYKNGQKEQKHTQACWGGFNLNKDVAFMDVICPLRGPESRRDILESSVREAYGILYDGFRWNRFKGEAGKDPITVDEVRQYLEKINLFGIEIQLHHIEEDDEYPFVVCRVVCNDVVTQSGTFVAFACCMLRHIYEHGAVVRALINDWDDNKSFITNYAVALDAKPWDNWDYRPSGSASGHSCFPWEQQGYTKSKLTKLSWDFLDVIDWANRNPEEKSHRKNTHGASRHLTQEQLSYV